jgi:hypothetical protein
MIMTANESLSLSLCFKDLVQRDLSHVFQDFIPVDMIEQRAREVMQGSRERIFTAPNTILTMLLSAVNEDKSLQHGLNLFKVIFESQCKRAIEEEQIRLEAEKARDAHVSRRAGRPKQYKSKLPKCYRQPLSDSTAGYATARENVDKSIFEDVYHYSTDFGDLDQESWYGMKTFICDGTYLQLQDTKDIRTQYTVKGQEESYPQALLQVMLRQGSGQISQFALGNRQQSELLLTIPMIRELEENSLLLADDLYNTYYHFCLTKQQKCHIIVPGKRSRNYKVVRDISDNDQIVEVSKTVRPDYVSKEEWKSLPDKILLRRIEYTYPTKSGLESAILYTTIVDEKITSAEIVAKYTMRWDIEICIREIKTLMDINVLRSKSRDMLYKELLISLTAYNMVRKVIAKSADKVGFSPQEDIFQKCNPLGRNILLDKKGRVFFKWSPGRYGYTNGANQQTSNPASKGEKTTLSEKN